MKADAAEPTDVRGALAALRDEIARLSKRVAELEVAASAQTVAMAPDGRDAASGAPISANAELDEELVLVISAAVAAFLGVKPKIRQIRLLRSDSWAEHGRATIQASHVLSVHHHHS